MTQLYDFLVIGTGLFGSVFAQQAVEAGKRVLVIDRRPHIGGNCHSEDVGGIEVHSYGPHLFHTSNERIWRYVNRFAEFNSYRHKVWTTTDQGVLPMPVGLAMLNRLKGISTPAAAQDYFIRMRANVEGDNAEAHCLRTIGAELYELVIKGYTQKQWNRHPCELPSSIVKRLPVRLTFNTDYSDDTFQGVPIGGYTKMVGRMLEGADVVTGVDFLKARTAFHKAARKIVYSGAIDELFDYDLGHLAYRSLRFEHEQLNMSDYQGCGQMNYAPADVPWTRITEHRHFAHTTAKHTVITREYPADDGEPCYPINDDANNALAARYQERAKAEGYIVGGRLGSYKYLDMHQAIGKALKTAKEVLSA